MHSKSCLETLGAETWPHLLNMMFLQRSLWVIPIIGNSIEHYIEWRSQNTKNGFGSPYDIILWYYDIATFEYYNVGMLWHRDLFAISFVLSPLLFLSCPSSCPLSCLLSCHLFAVLSCLAHCPCHVLCPVLCPVRCPVLCSLASREGFVPQPGGSYPSQRVRTPARE